MTKETSQPSQPHINKVCNQCPDCEQCQPGAIEVAQELKLTANYLNAPGATPAGHKANAKTSRKEEREQAGNSASYSKNAPASLLQRLKALWKKRRRAPGFLLLLFYCHMVMFFCAWLRKASGIDFSENMPLFLEVSSIYVPLIFGITTVSLLLRHAVYAGSALGLLHTASGFAGFLEMFAHSSPSLSEEMQYFILAILCGLTLLLGAVLWRVYTINPPYGPSASPQNDSRIDRANTEANSGANIKAGMHPDAQPGMRKNARPNILWGTQQNAQRDQPDAHQNVHHNSMHPENIRNDKVIGKAEAAAKTGRK